MAEEHPFRPVSQPPRRHVLYSGVSVSPAFECGDLLSVVKICKYFLYFMVMIISVFSNKKLFYVHRLNFLSYPQIQILLFVCMSVFYAVLFLLCNSGSLVVNYPFDDDKDGNSYYSKSPDDEVFQQVSRAYSQVTGHRCCGSCLSLILIVSTFSTNGSSLKSVE